MNTQTLLRILLKILDDALKNINSDYEAKRHKNMTLALPKIHQAKNGLFYKWLKSKNKLGGQHKVPRMSNKRDFLEELLELEKSLKTLRISVLINVIKKQILIY